MTLTYLRRNRVQKELAEALGPSQSTISRAIGVLTALIGDALAQWIPAATLDAIET